MSFFVTLIFFLRGYFLNQGFVRVLSLMWFFYAMIWGTGFKELIYFVIFWLLSAVVLLVVEACAHTIFYLNVARPNDEFWVWLPTWQDKRKDKFFFRFLIEGAAKGGLPYE